MRRGTTDYAIRWVVIAVFALLAIIGLKLLGVSLDRPSTISVTRVLGEFFLLVPLFMMLAWRAPKYAHLTATPIDLVHSIVQLAAVVQVFLPISYIAADLSRHFPLMDDRLAGWDAFLFGSARTALAHWVDARPAVAWTLAKVYSSTGAQAVILLIIGSFLRPHDRNSELIWLAIAVVTFTAAISIFTPALGGTGYIGTSHIDILRHIRAGAWKTFSYDHTEGLVTFPSFHTTLALIFIYVAARTNRWALLVFGPLNAVMLISISPVGGHYLVDMLGGAAVAVASIASVLLLRLEESAFCEPIEASSLEARRPWPVRSK